MRNRTQIKNPDKIISYFKMEWGILLLITVSGIFYNIGLLAGPWFEGKLAQCLMDILNSKKEFNDMLVLSIIYVGVIASVQISRYIKRFYVRRFGNHVNKNMKQVLYANLIHYSKAELENENIGNVITKAISDVDACAEGMRKFTTEIFDTGVVLIGYIVLLLSYDWKLTLICLMFPPIPYLLAEKLKKNVQKSSAESKESRSRLNAATLERVTNASTYRVFGCENQRDITYEKHLNDYEKTSVKANIWVAALPPLYKIISMFSVLFILYFGAENVMGTGFTNWDIAAFTTFLSCYNKLAKKTSKSAKLFNSVHQAEVSWNRIKPLMKTMKDDKPLVIANAEPLVVKNLGMSYTKDYPIFTNLSFQATPGTIIGVSGPVACGKSTLGKAFLCEIPYEGSITFGGEELISMKPEKRWGIVGYMGHDPELLSDTIENNINLGDIGNPMEILETVCLDKEVKEMKDGLHTIVGSGGVRLSGGQQARLSLARTLAHPRPLYILDDPFSALDQETERKVFENMKKLTKDSIIILISHRLYLFPQFDQIIFMEDGKTLIGTHEELMKNCKTYASIYRLQEGDTNEETK